MPKLKMMLCALMLSLASAGCSSQKPTLQPVSAPQPQYPVPEAWAMQPHSNSLQTLDATFSISEPE